MLLSAGLWRDKCGQFSKPVYGRLERVVDMLLSLLKKVNHGKGK